jgi:hypothetical protein
VPALTRNDFDLFGYAADRLLECGRQPERPCKLCAQPSPLFDVVDFNKQCDYVLYPENIVGIPVYYRRCDACGLVFTNFFDELDKDAWTRFVYNEDYKRIDPEFSRIRPERDARFVKELLKPYWREGDGGFDYGGGAGVFAERMRQAGMNFLCVDPFGVDERPEGAGPERFLTSFEVFEHFVDLEASLEEAFGLCRTDEFLAIVGTKVVPAKLGKGQLSQWYYAGPRNGHITFYTTRSMELIAQRLGAEYRAVSSGMHLFGRGFDLKAISRRALGLRAMTGVNVRMRRWFAKGTTAWPPASLQPAAEVYTAGVGPLKDAKP